MFLLDVINPMAIVVSKVLPLAAIAILAVLLILVLKKK